MELLNTSSLRSKYVDTFGRKEEDLLEIAKSTAQKKPHVVAKGIKDIVLKTKINSNELLHFVERLGINYTSLAGQQFLYEIIKSVYNTNFASKSTTKENSLTWLETKLKTPPWDNPLQQMRLWQWMMKITCLAISAEEILQLFIEQQSLI